MAAAEVTITQRNKEKLDDWRESRLVVLCQVVGLGHLCAGIYLDKDN